MKVRSLLAPIALLILGASAAPAQSARLELLGGIPTEGLRGQVSITAIGGGVSSIWHYSTTDDYMRSLTGFTVGVALLRPIGRHFGFAPEVLYVQRGASLQYPGDLWIDYRLHYVEVPLLLRYSVLPSRTVRPFIAVGPEIGINVSCSTKATNGPQNGSTVIFDPCTTGDGPVAFDEPDRLDFGMIFGAGICTARICSRPSSLPVRPLAFPCGRVTAARSLSQQKKRAASKFT